MKLKALLLAAGLATPAAAAVTQLTVEKTTPMAGGYELLEGHFKGALDPANPHNAIINDITLAPRNVAGRVEYSATFQIARPTGPLSGVLLYDVPNRGKGTAQALGDGHVNVVSGWQGDIAPEAGRQTIDLPTAAVTGMAIVQFIDMPTGTTTMPIKGGPQGGIRGRNFEPATADGARLYTLASDDHPQERVEVPRTGWALADCNSTPFPGKPDLTKLCVKGGFDPKLSYTLAFRATNPKLQGIGFAATRDLVAFLRYARKDAQGNPNPLAGAVHWAIGRGVSQSGNYLRGLIRLGFNSAEDGRTVFDGLNPIIAQRQLPMNFRFATPGGLAYLYEAGSDGPDWWGDYDDTVRGQGKTSLLDRCRAARNCPKIAEVFGAAEFWNLRASPALVGTDARADIALPGNVRRYYIASVTHGGGRGGFALESTPVTSCVLMANPNPASDSYRALLAGLIDWVARGTEPPASKFPTIAAGDLAAPTAAAMGFPNIPGAPSPDGKNNPLLQYDFGAHFNSSDLSGVIDAPPPRVSRVLPSLVPRVDADGNELAGIRSPLLEAPLGTYVGWNVTASGFEAGRFCGNNGGYIPFAATKAERIAKGDPRPSLEERYPSHAAYVARVKAQADKLVAQRYMLAADAARIMREADAAKVP